MPSPPEPAGEVVAGDQDAAGASAELTTAPEQSPPPPSRPPSAEQRRAPNRAATAALIAGILGATGLGVLLGLGFGAFGLNRSRRVGSGKVRCWVGIVLSLLWAGAIIYIAPHVIKAADPGCTTFKEKTLVHYNQAIEDFDTRAAPAKMTADLDSAIAGLRAAAGKSKNPQSRTALRNLAAQLQKARTDEHSGQIPASVMQALNHDAVAADNACGTI